MLLTWFTKTALKWYSKESWRALEGHLGTQDGRALEYMRHLRHVSTRRAFVHSETHGTWEIGHLSTWDARALRGNLGTQGTWAHMHLDTRELVGHLGNRGTTGTSFSRLEKTLEKFWKKKDFFNLKQLCQLNHKKTDQLEEDGNCLSLIFRKSWFMASKIRLNKDIFQIYCINCEFGILFIYGPSSFSSTKAQRWIV